MGSSVQITPIQPFPEWLPDFGNFSSGAVNVKNCVSYGGIYKPLASFVTDGTDALPSQVRGAYAVRGQDGTTHIFAGTRTKLYKLNGLSWDDVTRTSGDYTLGEDNYWVFSNYGDKVVATSYTDTIQVFDVGSDTEFSELVDIRARDLMVFNDQLHLIDTVDADGDKANRHRYSALGDITDFTPDIDTQAGFKDFLDGGQLNVKLVKLQNFGLIIQDNAIVRFDYVGGDVIYSYSLDEIDRGSKLARSVVSDGQFAYFLDEDGFYKTDGRNTEAIGRNKVDRWFNNDYRFASNYDYNLSASIDPNLKLIVWAFPSTVTGAENPDTLLTYNTTDGRWTYVEQEVWLLFQGQSLGVTLEELSTQYPNIENVPFSFDSRVWQGGRLLFSGFSSDNKLGNFAGDIYEAVITTSEQQLTAGKSSDILGVVPFIEDGAVTCKIGKRNKITDPITYTGSSSLNSYTGEIDITTRAKYAHAEFTVTGDWNNARGFAYRYRAGGQV